MAYDEELAERVREALGEAEGLTEKKMFGGIAFLHYGNMALGIMRDDLMVRVGTTGQAEALGQPGTRPMEFGGRSSMGIVFVAPEVTRKDGDLRRWVQRGITFARTLPPKAKKKPAAKVRPKKLTGSRTRG